MVDLYEKIKKGVKFSEATNTPIPGEKVFYIAYLLILRNEGMEKTYEQWEDIQVDQKKWKAFKGNFAQAYRRYHILNKWTATTHGYGASENLVHETDAQVMTADALHAVSNSTMANLTRINLKLSQSVTQEKEENLMLYMQPQMLQAQMNTKKTATEKTANEKKNCLKKSKRYWWTHGRNRNIDHTRPTCN